MRGPKLWCSRVACLSGNPKFRGSGRRERDAFLFLLGFLASFLASLGCNDENMEEVVFPLVFRKGIL